MIAVVVMSLAVIAFAAYTFVDVLRFQRRLNGDV